MLSQKVNAQSCAAPLPLTINSCNQYIADDTIAWSSFNSGSGSSWCTIKVTTPSTNPGTITGVDLYSGNCSSPTLVRSGFFDVSVGGFFISSSVSPSTSYLVKITMSGSSNGEFITCTNVMATGVACTCTTSGCQFVTNPDLEQYTWTNANQHLANFVTSNLCCNWGTPGATPDFFTPTALDPQVDAPTNLFGTESAHSGTAYGGIYCFYDIQGNFREYLQHHLQSQLVAGEWYTISFWVSLGENSGYAVDGLGAYVSAGSPPPTQNLPATLLSNCTPQVVCTTAVTTDNGWGQITGSFKTTAGIGWI